MKNENYRKYTSITLMAIMVAGGLTFAIPGVQPAQADMTSTNPHLFVSAEGQDADNMFAEGNIIEVVILDPGISDTDEGEGEPDVTVNGADLRMLQGKDGAWYAYFAEVDALAAIEAATGDLGGVGLDYGTFCDAIAADAVSGNIELTDTNGVYFPYGSVTNDCTNIDTSIKEHGLIREAKDLNNQSRNGLLGQLGLAHEALWPFIQTFDFTSLGSVEVTYHRAGGSETVDLLFDDPEEDHSLDRDKYPQSAEVQVTLYDYTLNIDPTDEDTWAFNTVSGATAAYYNLFDEDGEPLNVEEPEGSINYYEIPIGLDETLLITRNAQNSAKPLIDCQVTGDYGIIKESDPSMDKLMQNDDGVCVEGDAYVGLDADGIFTADSFVINFVEEGPNNDSFINWAEDKRANLVVRDDAARGNTFEIEYASPGFKSGVVGHFFGEFSLGLSDATWNSGERVGITLTDGDANTNPLDEDDLLVADFDSLLIPSIRIGSPVTLGDGSGSDNSNLDVAWYSLDPITIDPADVTINQIDDIRTFDDTKDVTFTGTATGAVTLSVEYGGTQFELDVQKTGMNWTATHTFDSIASQTTYTVTATATQTDGTTSSDSISFDIIKGLLSIDDVEDSTIFTDFFTLNLRGTAKPGSNVFLSVPAANIHTNLIATDDGTWSASPTIDPSLVEGESRTYEITVQSDGESEQDIFVLTKKTVSIDSTITDYATFDDQTPVITFNGTAPAGQNVTLTISSSDNNYSPTVTQRGVSWEAQQAVAAPATPGDAITYTVSVVAGVHSDVESFIVTKKELTIQSVPPIETYNSTHTVSLAGVANPNASLELVIIGDDKYEPTPDMVGENWSATEDIKVPTMPGATLNYTVDVDSGDGTETKMIEFSVTKKRITINPIDSVKTFADRILVDFSGNASSTSKPILSIVAGTDDPLTPDVDQDGENWTASQVIRVPNAGSVTYTATIDTDDDSASTTFTVTRETLSINPIANMTTFAGTATINISGIIEDDSTVNISVTSNETEYLQRIDATGGTWSTSQIVAAPSKVGESITYTVNATVDLTMATQTFTITREALTISDQPSITTFAENIDVTFSGKAGADVTLGINGQLQSVTVSPVNQVWTATVSVPVPSEIGGRITYTATAISGGDTVQSEFTVTKGALTIDPVNNIDTYNDRVNVQFTGTANPQDTVTLAIRAGDDYSVTTVTSNDNGNWAISYPILIPDSDDPILYTVTVNTLDEAKGITFTITKPKQITIDPIMPIRTFDNSYNVVISGTAGPAVSSIDIEIESVDGTAYPLSATPTNGTWSATQLVSVPSDITYQVTATAGPVGATADIVFTRAVFAIDPIADVATFASNSTVNISGIADAAATVTLNIENETGGIISSPSVVRSNEAWSSSATVPVPGNGSATYTVVAMANGDKVRESFTVKRETLTIDPIATITTFDGDVDVQLSGTIQLDASISLTISNTDVDMTIPYDGAEWTASASIPTIAGTTTYNVTVSVGDVSVYESFDVIKKNFSMDALDSTAITAFDVVTTVSFSGIADPKRNVSVEITDNTGTTTSATVSPRDGEKWSALAVVPVPAVVGESITYTVEASSFGSVQNATFTVTKGQLTVDPIDDMTIFKDDIRLTINGSAKPNTSLTIQISGSDGPSHTVVITSGNDGSWAIPLIFDSPATGMTTTYTIKASTSEETKSVVFDLTKQTLSVKVKESGVTTFEDFYTVELSGVADPTDDLAITITDDSQTVYDDIDAIMGDGITWSATHAIPTPTPNVTVTYDVKVENNGDTATTSFTLTGGRLTMAPLSNVTTFDQNVTVSLSGTAHPDHNVVVWIADKDDLSASPYQPTVTRTGTSWSASQVINTPAAGTSVTYDVSVTASPTSGLPTALSDSFTITAGKFGINPVGNHTTFAATYDIKFGGMADPAGSTPTLTVTGSTVTPDPLVVVRDGLYWTADASIAATNTASITATVSQDGESETIQFDLTAGKYSFERTTKDDALTTHEATVNIEFKGYADPTQSLAVTFSDTTNSSSATTIAASTINSTDNTFTGNVNLPVPTMPGSITYNCIMTHDGTTTPCNAPFTVVRPGLVTTYEDEYTSFADKVHVEFIITANPEATVSVNLTNSDVSSADLVQLTVTRSGVNFTASAMVNVPDVVDTTWDYDVDASITYPGDTPNTVDILSGDTVTVTRGSLTMDDFVSVTTLADQYQLNVTGMISDNKTAVSATMNGGNHTHMPTVVLAEEGEKDGYGWYAIQDVASTSSVSYNVTVTAGDTSVWKWHNITRGVPLEITSIMVGSDNVTSTNGEVVMFVEGQNEVDPVIYGKGSSDIPIRVVATGPSYNEVTSVSHKDGTWSTAEIENIPVPTGDDALGESLTYIVSALVEGKIDTVSLTLINGDLMINPIDNVNTAATSYDVAMGGYHNELDSSTMQILISGGGYTDTPVPEFVDNTWSASATVDAPDVVGDTIEYTVTVLTGDDSYTEKFNVTRTATGTSQSSLLVPTPTSSLTGFPSITKAVLDSIADVPSVHPVISTIVDDSVFPANPSDWGYKLGPASVWSSEVQKFSDRMLINSGEETVTLGDKAAVVVSLTSDLSENLRDIAAPSAADCSTGFCGTVMFNYDISSLSNEGFDVEAILLSNGTHAANLANDDSGNAMVDDAKIAQIDSLTGDLSYVIILDSNGMTGDFEFCHDMPIVIDFFSFGLVNLGVDPGDRVNNAIYRIEVEEASTNSDNFVGTIEYTMLNQLNTLEPSTYENLRTIDDEILMIIHEDFTDEDSVRVNYLDLGADGVSTQIAIQQEAPTHSGIVDLDMDSYKVADTVNVVLTDADLNVNNDVIDVYTIVDPTSGLATSSTVGSSDPSIGDYTYDDGTAFGRLLDITFDDEIWTSAAANGCTDASSFNDGFYSTGFTLIETASNSGIFTGNFQVPDMYCPSEGEELKSVTGTDIEVNYLDFRDTSGEIIERGDSAAIRAHTGTVSLDRTVYPVPFGPNTFETFGAPLPEGILYTHIRVNDPDFDISAAGEDTMPSEYLKVNVIRGSASQTVEIADFTIKEIAPDAGIFELDLPIAYDAGPSQSCPDEFTDGCVLQGDIIQVEYSDPTDASGEPNTVTDSATFDLRNGVLQADKSVYLIGSDMILTLIEPDFDLDNDAAETYSLNLIEWDSDAATVPMGQNAAFDPEPSDLRETGDSTGIFQIIIEIPAELEGDRLERGEEIELEYVDWGPSGSDYVGEESEDINLTVYTSNFGATIELDQKVYSWTDKVYITIVAPDHNFDSALIDEIGESDLDPIEVSTRSADLNNYKLVETGPDTGIFTGEVILIGFEHDADGDATTGNNLGYDNPQRPTEGSGPTDGYLRTDDDDGITVSFEFSEDETVVGSALIRWNIGEVQWLESSYPATGSGVVRVIDPDMNWNPEAVDNFEVDVWSDSDAGGIDLTVTETNEATGIFEGTVVFTTTEESSGHRLRVAEANTVTAEYEDNTLPDPYTTADELDVTATTLIGTTVPPLERVPASNLRVVDTFGNSLDTVMVGQQVQIVADVLNNQDRTQVFAYLVQVQDENGVTVSLAWITGSLEGDQSLSPSSSWIPDSAGTYSATAFVWESVDNPTALSPPVSTTITVS